MRKLGYVAPLDGIRALAITVVVCSHATGFPAGGWLGVDLFFVLSGFLITTLLLVRRGRESIGAFYQRRAFRLLPAQSPLPSPVCLPRPNLVLALPLALPDLHLARR